MWVQQGLPLIRGNVHSTLAHSIPICAQVKRCADAGADIVRITVQGNKEAEACGKIRDKLFQQGCVPQQCSFS